MRPPGAVSHDPLPIWQAIPGPPRGTSPRSAGRCSCSAATHDSCRRAVCPRAATCNAPWRNGTRAGRMPCARSTALCAVPPSASTPRSRGIAAISAVRNRLQVPISTGVGRLPGGTQRTALVTRQSASTSPSSGVGPIAAVREAEMQQRPVQQFAGEIAGERPSGPVGAAHARRQPDDQQTRIQAAETWHRRVEPVGVGGAVGLPVLGEPRAERAIRRGMRSPGAPHAASCGSENGSAGVWRSGTVRTRGSVWRRVNSGRDLGEFQELVGLAAQFVGHHRRAGADRGHHGDPHAFALHRLHQPAEVGIAAEQDRVIDPRRTAPACPPRPRCPCCP